jgi:type IV fimbrial biogenesis protein FimT
MSDLRRPLAAPAWSPAQRGITLIELMFTLLVLAVLIAIAAPSFRDASLGGRLTATANSLLGSIQIARSEAIKANAPATLCTSTDGATCATTGDWDQGWIVLDAEGNVIHSEPAQPDGFKVVEAASVRTFTFQPIGIGNTAGVFTICRETPLGKQERVLSMTATGIANVVQTEDGACP